MLSWKTNQIHCENNNFVFQIKTLTRLISRFANYSKTISKESKTHLIMYVDKEMIYLQCISKFWLDFRRPKSNRNNHLQSITLISFKTRVWREEFSKIPKLFSDVIYLGFCEKKESWSLFFSDQNETTMRVIGLAMHQVLMRLCAVKKVKSEMESFYFSVLSMNKKK